MPCTWVMPVDRMRIHMLVVIFFSVLWQFISEQTTALRARAKMLHNPANIQYNLTWPSAFCRPYGSILKVNHKCVSDSRIGLDDMLVGSESDMPPYREVLQILTTWQETLRTSFKIAEVVTTAEIDDFALTIEY